MKEITEERKCLLHEELNNENIEIIDILAKDIILPLEKVKIEVKAYGIDELIECLKKCQKNLIKCSLKKIKSKMKEKYLMILIKNIKR